MIVKRPKSLANSSRKTVLIDYRKTLVSDIPEPRRLLRILKKHSGRETHTGQITTRHQGGRNKRFYRVIDFKRYDNDNVIGTIKNIQYDPNRNCNISLVTYRNGDRRFILSPEGIKTGDKIVSGNDENVPLKVGNNLLLKHIPLNTPIHNLSIKPGKEAQLLRSAGSYGEIIGKEENGQYVLVKLRSKEVRKVLAICRATIGKVGNSEVSLIRLGKAGRNRWKGIRPTVRGSAMNAVDHPHGGGKDKQPIGRSSPRDPWGNKTLGKKTRKKSKPSNNYIVCSRHKSKKIN